jgi:hypothetical protein
MRAQEPFDRLAGAVLAPGAALAAKGPSRQDSAPCLPTSDITTRSRADASRNLLPQCTRRNMKLSIIAFLRKHKHPQLRSRSWLSWLSSWPCHPTTHKREFSRLLATTDRKGKRVFNARVQSNVTNAHVVCCARVVYVPLHPGASIFRSAGETRSFMSTAAWDRAISHKEHTTRRCLWCATSNSAARQRPKMLRTCGDSARSAMECSAMGFVEAK